LTPQGNQKSDKPRSSKHRLLWILVVLFIVLSITAMMMADYYFAPGPSGNTAEPKDAAEK
jgi:flagellar basal body-associated protein FliL